MTVSSARHKEITAHIRARLASHGIKARVRMMTCCGSQSVQVFGATYDARFTPEQIHTICAIAEANHMTFVRGMPIVPAVEAELTGKTAWEFHI